MHGLSCREARARFLVSRQCRSFSPCVCEDGGASATLRHCCAESTGPCTTGHPACSAHAGSRTRVTSMGGLYDAATLRALLASPGGDYSKTAFDFSSMHIIQWLRTGSPCVRNGFDSCARGSATAVRHGWRRLWSLDRGECCAESPGAWTLPASLRALRTPGVEPGSTAWGGLYGAATLRALVASAGGGY